MEVMKAVKTSNNDVGGRKFEMSNMAYIVRDFGYIKNIKDVEDCHQNYNSVPGKRYRFRSNGWRFTSGYFDANGEGEVSEDCVVRYGENADKVCA
jgi:Cu(I)/Ag(I) efflux system membrane protein CusA/SilA